MTALGLRIRHLSFLGPSKPSASVKFGPGFNVLYGASDTGKSFVADAIDFMLGGKGPLRDIPEREGYDRILLGMESLSGEAFTIYRSMNGGSFRVYEGLYLDDLPAEGGAELHDQHNDRRDDNLSKYLLTKIGLADRRIRRNRSNETSSLSFRNVARLAIVDEEEIIQKRSPLSDGNFVADTANTSTFKLLLTGVDDSSLVSSARSVAAEYSRSGQLELLTQLISQQEARVRQLSGPSKELEEQDQKLQNSMRAREELLAQKESEYRETSGRRRILRRRLEEANERLAEVRVLLERFDLLKRHYASDTERLGGIVESGSLFAALSDGSCPLCGAEPSSQHKSEDCGGNPQEIVNAAKAEIVKIEILQTDLGQTIGQLKKEARNLERRLPLIESDIDDLSLSIEEHISPNLRAMRQSYGELADKRAEVREALGIYDTLKDLQDRKTILEAEDAQAGGGNSDSDLPASSIDRFATTVLEILQAWHFPNAQRVHFDQKTRDLVINGKSRIAFGKGLRAITQSAFSIALLQYCRMEETPHPGFVLLDSPLLSYKEPDGEDDDLRHTDLKQRFYVYLKNLEDSKQVIIIENTDPPEDIQSLPQALKFTGNSEEGRAGLFSR